LNSNAYKQICLIVIGGKTKTLKISEETHTELTKMKGQLMLETGKANLTYDEVLMELIKRSKKD
jgi:predicted CopG family antitoxin